MSPLKGEYNLSFLKNTFLFNNIHEVIYKYFPAFVCFNFATGYTLSCLALASQNQGTELFIPSYGQVYPLSFNACS